MMGDGMMGGGMWIWMFFGAIFWLLLVAGVVLLVIWIVQRTAAGKGVTPGETALDILKKRYARGEISREEFEEMKRNMT